MLDAILAKFASHFGDMPLPAFLAFFAAAGAVLVISLRSAFRNLSWWRMIEDVPTSPTRSAHQGYVELVGEAELMDGPPITTPMTGLPCVWWSLKVQENRGGEWEVHSSEQSDELFYLRDAVGVCIVDPDHAKVTANHRRTSKGSRNAPFKTPGLLSGNDYLYTERFIKAGDPLYVIGLFQTFNSIDHWDNDEELVHKLREWKRDQPALIRRFDADGDGRIDEQEWAEARAQARAEIEREHRTASAEPGVNVIGAPPDGRPFLIAAQHEQFFTRNLRINAAGSALAVVFSGAILLLMLASRL